MSAQARPLDLTIRSGDLVRTSTLSSTIYVRPMAKRWHSRELQPLTAGTPLLVVRGPERIDHDGSWRSYTLNVLLDGQMFEVMLEDVERLESVEQ